MSTAIPGRVTQHGEQRGQRLENVGAELHAEDLPHCAVQPHPHPGHSGKQRYHSRGAGASAERLPAEKRDRPHGQLGLLRFIGAVDRHARGALQRYLVSVHVHLRRRRL